MFKTRKYIFLIMLFTLAIWSCSETDHPVYQPTPYQITIPFGFPTLLNIPDDNPLTAEGIELGRILFYDGRLSGRTQPDSLMSCFTCHIQSKGFECGVDHPRFTNGHPFGLTGIYTHHSMLPLINLVFNQQGYFWNGMVEAGNPDARFRKLEDIVRMTITAPDEINGDTSKTVILLNGIPGYPPLFEKAFGDRTITMNRISKAIAQFVRTLISANSRFDQYLRGELQLTDEELRGYVLFTTEEGGDCFHCHGGDGNPLFTTNLFYNNGKDTVFNGTSGNAHDRFLITGDPMDIGAYRAPTLRNIEKTAPYMHDGRFKTLEEVVDFYSHHILISPSISPLMHHAAHGGVQLTPQEKNDLIAFLKALTDLEFLTNPQYSAPGNIP